MRSSPPGVSRRGFWAGLPPLPHFLLGGGLAANLCLRDQSSWRTMLGFTGIAVSSADTVVVQEGYTAKVLIAWGDPCRMGPSSSNAATAPPSKRCSGACITTASLTSQSADRVEGARAKQRVHRRVLLSLTVAGWNQERQTRRSPLTAYRSSRSRRAEVPETCDDDDDDDDDDGDYGGP